VRASAIVRARLSNQQLSRSDFTTPRDVVAWLGAVQAQDLDGAKWAVGLRTRHATAAAIEQAFAAGEIVRTHVLRPTWHFVAPADIRWMLQLTAPRVNLAMHADYRKYELDEAAFRRSRAALTSTIGCRRPGGLRVTKR
jgi:hypothetical protein